MRKPVSLLACFFIPFLVLVLGLSLAGIYGYRAIPWLFEETARGMIPEGFEVPLGNPGKYTVWLFERGQGEEGFYRGSGKLPPGGKLHIFDSSTGREIPLTNWVVATRNSGHEKAVSLGTFMGQREGQVVEVKGTGLRKSMLVSVAPSNTGPVLRVVLSLLGIVALTLSAAILLFLLLLHRRQKILEGNE
jgi:hypothetical protein